MKNEQNKLINNQNLLKGLISYLNCKDLSQTAQVSVKFRKISTTEFNHYWREECNSHFCSNYQHNR